MMQLGDYVEDYATLNFKFMTKDVSDVPTTLAGAPVISVYAGSSIVQSVVGVTLAVDFDGIVGLNNVLIDLSADAFYVPAEDYHVVITTGTVNGVSVVGTTVAQFSIENRSDTPVLASILNKVQKLATGSSAISTVSESATITTGVATNAYTDTFEADGVYHSVVDASGVMDLYYQFDVGGTGVAASVTMAGRVNGAANDLGIYAYNWGTASWEQIGTLNGKNGSADDIIKFNLLLQHTGSGADIGKVRVRGYAASGLTSATLYLDQLYVSYTVISQASAYQNAAIWIDTLNGVAGTTDYYNGTASNPVSNFADALTLAASTGLKKFEVSSGSTITLTATISNYAFNGENWNLALNGKTCNGTVFAGAAVSGTGVAATDAIRFLQATLGTCTLGLFHADACSLNGTITLATAGDYVLSNCRSIIAGTVTPIIDVGDALADVNLTLPNYNQGLELRNLNTLGVDNFSISGTGQIVYAASCSGTVHQRGDWKVTNTGGVAINTDDNTGNTAAILLDTGTTLPSTLATANTDIAAVDARVAAEALEVTAIKAKTDNLTFTKTLELDTNTQSINSSTVVGDGKAIPWEGT